MQNARSKLQTLSDSACHPLSDSACHPLSDSACHPYKVILDGDGEVWAEYYNSDSKYLIRYPGVAEFRYDTGAKHIECSPFPGIGKQAIFDLLVNQIRPLTRSIHGALVLHASAVKVGTGACLFLGASGAGKSTLATFFALKDHFLVCEDGAVFAECSDEILIEPGHRSIRLWPDSRRALEFELNDKIETDSQSNKQRLFEPHSVKFADELQSVRAVFHIDAVGANTVELSRLTPRDALSSCLNNMFLLDDQNTDVLLSHFDQLASLSNSIPHFLLKYPRNFRMLDQVRNSILRRCDEFECNHA